MRTPMGRSQLMGILLNVLNALIPSFRVLPSDAEPYSICLIFMWFVASMLHALHHSPVKSMHRSSSTKSIPESAPIPSCPLHRIDLISSLNALATGTPHDLALFLVPLPCLDAAALTRRSGVVFERSDLALKHSATLSQCFLLTEDVCKSMLACRYLPIQKESATGKAVNRQTDIKTSALFRPRIDRQKIRGFFLPRS